MSVDFEKLKQEMPEEYHFLLNHRLIDTDSMTNEFRVKNMNGAKFNKCERCGYDLLISGAYRKTEEISKRHPANGYVSYYDRFKLIICDRCLDRLNGQPWK